VTAAASVATPKDSPPAKPPRRTPNPWLLVGIGVALIAVAVLLVWLEPREAPPPTAAERAAEQQQREERARRIALQQAREREAQARAEAERRAAEEAAEKARRAEIAVDGTAEALARAQREELARKQAAVEAAHRAAAEQEAAWKRFYQPSARCREPAAATSVECINEFVKAKREFEERRGSS